MSKLQACAKCGAQFDVAAMAAGQRFTCGACGAVVTVGGASAPSAGPSRVPGTSRVPGASSPGVGAGGVPSRAVPAPQASNAGRASSSRGPQYVPPERSMSGAKPAPRGNDRGNERGNERDSRRERSERGGGPAKKGLSPAAMAGIGGGILAIAVGALMLSGKGKGGDPKSGGPGSTTTVAGGTNGAGGMNGAGGAPTPGVPGPGMGGGTGMDATDAPSTDTMATLAAEWTALGHPTTPQFREYLKRFKKVAGGMDKAKEIAAQMLKQGDTNDKDARELLGHKEFALDVPEEISFRKYPFVRAVEDAHAQRWFDDDESYALAMKAYEKTLAHAKKLATDREYQALDVARRGIDRDEHFKHYNYEAIFASPYLICYSDTERFDEESLISLPRAERTKKLVELEKKREEFQRILAEKAMIYPQLYAEFLKRYGETCDLHPLMDEFGGRADYPPGKQSYREGCPLIVWIFSDKKAFQEYHDAVKKESIDPGVAGYFSPDTGWVYLYDEPGTDREFEVNKNVHEGTHQLQHWFTKQKNEWGKPRVPQSFFGEGFAEYMGSVTMAKDRKLTFIGLNRPRLSSLKQIKDQLTQSNQKLFIFPLKELTSFQGYENVKGWGVDRWKVNPGFVLGLFYIQSWAFVYFLNENDNHKYQKNFKKYLDDMLNYPRDAENYGAEKFKRAMNINTDDDWKKLQKEFDAFYEKLIKMDLDKIGPKPPAHEDWPGYEAPGVDGGMK